MVAACCHDAAISSNDRTLASPILGVCAAQESRFGAARQLNAGAWVSCGLEARGPYGLKCAPIPIDLQLEVMRRRDAAVARAVRAPGGVELCAAQLVGDHRARDRQALAEAEADAGVAGIGLIVRVAILRRSQSRLPSPYTRCERQSHIG